MNRADVSKQKRERRPRQFMRANMVVARVTPDARLVLLGTSFLMEEELENFAAWIEKARRWIAQVRADGKAGRG